MRRSLRSVMRAAARRARRAVIRDDAAPAMQAVQLDDVRRRLELLLSAMYGRTVPIVTATQPERGNRVTRWVRGKLRQLQTTEVLAASDGARIHLPATLDDADGAALARYRVLAVEQAERIARGTALHAPDATSPLERDLYLLAEGAAVDASIVRAAPGLRGALLTERAAALARRPALESLTPVEQQVERMIRAQLEADPAHGGSGAVARNEGGPAEALVWARREAGRLRTGRERYRGVPAVPAWGTVLRGEGGMERGEVQDTNVNLQFRQDIGLPIGASGGKEEASPEGGSKAGEGAANEDAPVSESAGDSPNQRDRRDGAAKESGRRNAAPPTSDDASGAAGDAVDIFDPTADASPDEAALDGVKGTAYPEWDWRAHRHRPDAAIVREQPPTLGDAAWSTQALARHAGLVRRTRERFERLRRRRARLLRQRDGDELDLAACVRAMVDLRTGHSIDDRLYASVRPARRELAILLLVDISGSTDEWVADTRRVIDVEKVALLLASQAFDALGDSYAVQTFSGRGASDVRVRTVKSFTESNGDEIRRRIAALEPEGFTRLGAAVRHATRTLATQRAGHRLLLVLSDGKPNDEGGYVGRYAIEDARQAIAESRAEGVFPFCLTVDREGREYLERIFGRAGHEIMRHPDQLPTALLGVVRQLLRSGG